jgi:hypothetical protein
LGNLLQADLHSDDWQMLYDEHEAIAVRGHFDASYYLTTNPDVRESGMDPLAHFLITGWREGRNPSRGFNVNYYQRVNPDVVAANINPLVHYARAGAREGRRPHRALDALRTALESSRPLRVKADEWAVGNIRPATLNRRELADRLGPVISTTSALVVSVSHDDYDQNSGGIQNVIRDERFAVERMGMGYLHLSPAIPLPILAQPIRAEDYRFSLRLGADCLGIATAADLLECLEDIRTDGRPLSLVVHHFLGHAPELLLDLAKIMTLPTIVWVHDFLTLCANHNLLRNDVRFCGAPPLAATACGICAYLADRVELAPRIGVFFEAVKPVVLAPSESALSLWLRQGNLPHGGAHVQPLASIVRASEPIRTRKIDASGPIRVAHIGMRDVHKGWHVFEELALRHVGNPAYSFYQLGLGSVPIWPDCIKHVPIRVTAEDPDAMIDAIARHRIDVVVSWSLWPETFCFAAHEALAGGAYVLGRLGAGNVPDMIRKFAPEQGHMLEKESDLFELFERGSIENLLRTGDRRYAALVPGPGSTEWIRRALWGTPMSAPAAEQAESAIADV